MNNEEIFYRELSHTVELPSDLYDGVCKRMARKNLLKRSMLILIAAAVFSVTLIRSNHVVNVSQMTIEPEIASELQIIQEYLNGTDVSDDIDTYAFLDIE